MRLTRGRKVEVLMEHRVLCGSWRPAEIVSGNGRTYTVKYDRRPLPSDDDAGASGFGLRVRRKLIRPRPPAVEYTPDTGDIVEACENHEWRMAQVCRGPRGGDGGWCVVRYMGTQERRRVRSSDVRVRQIWRGESWYLIDRTSREFRRRNRRRRSTNEGQQRIDRSDAHQGEENKADSEPCSSVGSCSGPSSVGSSSSWYE